MQGIFHSLQIGTLSTWLSLTTFGTVGVIIQPWQAPPTAPLPIAEETEIIPNDFLLEAPSGPSGENIAASPAEATPIESYTPDLLPSPPVLAPLAELAPLPEIPDLPPSPPVSAVGEARATPRSSTTSTPSASTPRTTGTRSSSSGSSSAPNASGGGSNAATTASRLAAGRMPAPTYPASARRNNQTGSVLVEFTIGTDGRVMSAYAKVPSPHAILNEAAVNTVRRWKFPPGGILKTERRIDFVLNR